MAKTHQLKATPETVHWGYFEAALKPVLRIASGDTVEIECLVASRPGTLPGAGFEVPAALRAVHEKLEIKGSAHIITGPIWVEGAEPGDTLEVRIRDIRLAMDWGMNNIRPLVGTLPEDFPKSRLVHIPIDRKRKVCKMPWGTEIPLSPFFGVIGVAPPPAYGRIPSGPPREHGGNLDNKELLAGSTLYLPVWVPGALLSIGDGHGVQGDGEVDVSALETSLNGTFEIVLRKDLKLAYPRAETPTHYITMAFDTDLDDAAKRALRDMIGLIASLANLSREDAYMLCSLACDMHITQLVNSEKGVHAMLPKSAL
ncbi:MAG: acetamidase/formamidase family protein [Proteobacteria bacterium]|nr:acetamidase/formamidase family protein [Pseudomonadota bacterium]